MSFSYNFNKKITPDGVFPRLRIRASRAVFSLLIALLAAIGTHLIVRAAPTILATMTAAFIDGDGDGKADPGETIEYTSVIHNSGADPATGITFADVLDLNTTLVAGSVNVSPLAGDDSYDAIGNTLLDVGMGLPDPAAHVTNSAIDSLFDNDTEFLGDNFMLLSVEADTTAPFTTATEQGGTVAVEADGNFSYTPPVDFTGTDHFDYVITDDGAAGSDALTGAGRVTINVSHMVWYVKNDAAAGGLGRSTDPFDTLSEAQAASAANETIYVFQGNGTPTGQNAGIVLQSGQRLIGEGVALTVPVSVNGGANPTTLRAAGSQPQIDNLSGFGVSVPDISNAQVFGLNIAGSTNAVNVTTTAANSGSFELANNTIRSAGANGIDVNGGGSGTLTVNLHDNTVTATGNGIDIQRTAGNVTITAFDDNIIMGNTAGTGISIVGTGATILFDANPGTAAFDTVLGGTTVIGQFGNGVGLSGLVMNNIRGDLSFTDLDIYSDGGVALYINGTTPNFVVSGTGTRVTANTNTVTLSATGGPALDVQQANINFALTSLSSTNSPTTGVSFLTVGGTFSAPSGSTITNATGTDFFLNGNNNANANVSISYGGTITDDVGALVQIQNVTATSTHSFTGAITDSNDGDGSGISLTNNTGATITFSGGLLLSTGTNGAFTATGGGTVNVCDENPCNSVSTGALVNTLTTSTGTALNVTNTNIGANNLEFRSISSNGAPSGILLNTTGSTGRLLVKGNGGTCSSAVTCTGGAIQNSTSYGISLTSTVSPSFTRIAIQNAARSGIDGQQVTNFTLDNSFIDNVGTAALGQYEESNIAFNDGGAFNSIALSGTVSITNNALTNARRHGIDIENGNGTISNLTISNNILTSSTNASASLGTAILALIQGSTSTTAHLTTGTISGNTISNFPSGEGIAILGGSGNSSNNTLSTLGANGTPINITNNTISGQSAAASHLGSNAIRASMNSQVGVMNFNISCNGNTSAGCTATGPITNIQGQGISVFAGGSITGTTTVNNNVIVANQTLGAGTQGMAVQVDDGPAALNTSAADYNFIITNNNVSNYEGSGIRAIVRVSLGKMDVTIQNNTIGTPILTNRNGIRVDAGLSAPGDTTLCLNISGNTSDGSGVNQGIGIRKQGTDATVHEFGIVGLSPSPTTGANAAANIATDNPAGGGVDILSGDNFVNCAATAMLPDSNLVVKQSQPESSPVSLASAHSTSPDSANTFNASFASWKLSEQASENNLSHTVAKASTASGGKPLFTVQPVPAFSGETVSVPAFNLPAGKSITIKFRVTVDPLDPGELRTLISNQGTITGSNFSNVLTDDPSAGGGNDPTIIPVDRPDTTATSINRTVSSPTNTASVSWTVTFADAVSGLTNSNFTLVNSGLAGSPVITGVTTVGTAPATQWTVTASTGIGEGSLGLNLTNDTGLSQDVTNLTFTSQVYSIDRTPPTVTISSAAPNSTNTSPIPVTVQFSEMVNNFIAADIVASNATIDNFIAVDGDTYTFDLTPTGQGLVTANIGAGVAIDAAGNSNASVAQLSRTFDSIAPTVTMSSATSDPTNANPIQVTAQFSETVDNFIATDIVAGNATIENFIAVDGDTYTFDLTPSTPGLVTADIAADMAQDGTGNGNSAATQFSRIFDNNAPTVTITSAAPDPTNTSPISVTAQFSENVTGFDISDIAASNATVSNFIVVDGDTYAFELTPSGQGLLTAGIAIGAAQDSSGNTNSAATQFSRTFDSDAPTVTMTSAAPDPTNASPILVTVQFSEDVTGFIASDIVVNNATLGNFTTVDGDTYTFELAPVGSGLVTADIASGIATDGANFNSAASPFSRMFDSASPTVTLTSTAPDFTNTSPIPVTVQFSENVTGFNTGDITPDNAAISNFNAVDGDTYTFDLTPIADGLVTANIAAGVAQDGSGNGNSSASPFSRTVDTLAPSVTINQASGQVDPTSTSSINFTVIFSEPVTGFATSDVDLSMSTATGTLTGTISGGPTTYNVAVTGMTGDGMVIASIAAGAATDGANINSTATSSDNRVLYVANPTEHYIAGNVGLGGVVLSYTDVTAKTAISRADGSYSFSVSFNWTGTVTPSHACYTFGPVDQSYSNVFTDQTAQDYTPTFNSASACADIDVSIAGVDQGQYVLSAQESTQMNVAGLNSGLVKIESTGAQPTIGAEQVIYKVKGTNVSFSEMTGLPDSELDNTYWLPWYNNVDLDTQLRFGNVSSSTATVHVFIGNVEMQGSPFTLLSNQSTRVSFPEINEGPVKIESDQNIVVAERVIYKVKGLQTSFSEMMALPDSQLDTTYWLPWYNNIDLDTQLRIANVTNQPALIHVFIAGQEMEGSPFSLAPGEGTRVSFPGVNNGPVKIESNQTIVAAERVIYKVRRIQTSFSEMMALPDNQVGTAYWFPRYNNTDLDTQLRLANVSSLTATVRVYVGGIEMTSSPFTLLPNQSIRVSFFGVNSGPVKIESDRNIVTAERLIYEANGIPTSYSEIMGLPENLLNAIYWFPWYNNVDLDTRLRFVVP
ncbi:MAG TPA: Ig-like domain-containing protein [Anaerolineales bacterium]|nr:Ig-like domain-containing protein [Anaerolineales bacterium]